MLRTATLLVLLASPVWAAIGDKLQGTWNGSGNVDEYSLAFPAQANARRQVLSTCRNVTMTLSTTGNRLRIDVKYNCGGSLPSGTSNFDYRLRDVAGKPYREVIEAAPPNLVVGRIFDDGLDLIEHIVDDQAGDIIGLLLTLNNAKNVRLRLNWSEVGAPQESFSKYLTAPLKK